MKRHLNTLFVTTQGAYLAKEGETVVVKVDGEVSHTAFGNILFAAACRLHHLVVGA